MQSDPAPYFPVLSIEEFAGKNLVVPFDDRLCRAATIDDLSLPLGRSFLKEIGSRLYQERPRASLLELARLLNVVDGPDEAVTPRNVIVEKVLKHPDRAEATRFFNYPMAAIEEALVNAMKDREHFRKQYLSPLLEAGLIEMTIPDKPRSSKQEYRITGAGRKLMSSPKTEN